MKTASPACVLFFDICPLAVAACEKRGIKRAWFTVELLKRISGVRICLSTVLVVACLVSCSFVCLFFRSLVDWFVGSFVGSLVCLFVGSFVGWLVKLVCVLVFFCCTCEKPCALKLVSQVVCVVDIRVAGGRGL